MMKGMVAIKMPQDNGAKYSFHDCSAGRLWIKAIDHTFIVDIVDAIGGLDSKAWITDSDLLLHPGSAWRCIKIWEISDPGMFFFFKFEIGYIR